MDVDFPLIRYLVLVLQYIVSYVSTHMAANLEVAMSSVTFKAMKILMIILHNSHPYHLLLSKILAVHIP
jgi:hypothetical protein